MAQQQHQQMKMPEMPKEILRATQDIAAQAAMRAQERLSKVTAPPPSDVPEIPARSTAQKAPEIPPKRLSLKQPVPQQEIGKQSAPVPPQKPTVGPPPKVPPPLPQKPHQTNNNNGNTNQPVNFSPLMMAKFMDMQNAVDPRMSPQMIHKSPQLPNKMPGNMMPGASNLQRLQQQPNNNMNNMVNVPVNKKMNEKQKLISPSEDTSSEDALRGIESGLRNMERAMQEQMTLRSLEANVTASDSMNYNPMEFKTNLRTMGGSIPALDGAGQAFRMESFRMSLENHFNGNMKSLERGFSMEQMRMENGGGGNPMRTLESNPNIRQTIEELKMKQEQMNGSNKNNGMQPIEHHMRSLDRNLPLELQYSRNHRQHMQQQQQQQFLMQQQQIPGKMVVTSTGNNDVNDLREQVRHIEALSRSPMLNQRQTGVSREDLRMRRRSSHDENQIGQQPPGN